MSPHIRVSVSIGLIAGNGMKVQVIFSCVFIVTNSAFPVPYFLSLRSQNLVSSSIERALNKRKMLFLLLLPTFLLFHNCVPTSFIFRVICLGSHLYPLLCDVISSALLHPMPLSSLPLRDCLAWTCTLIIAPCSPPFSCMGLSLFRCSLTPPGSTHCSLCLECSCPAPPSDPA